MPVCLCVVYLCMSCVCLCSYVCVCVGMVNLCVLCMCVACVYVTGFAKRGLIRAFINTEIFRFEILIAVYLENACCLVYQLLHQSIVIQGNSAGALFDGLLAELPAILDSFFHQYHK